MQFLVSSIRWDSFSSSSIASVHLSNSIVQYCTESDSELGMFLNAPDMPELYLLLTSFATQGADLSFSLHPMAVEQKQRLQDTDECSENASLLSMWYLDFCYIIATHQKLQKALDYLLSDGDKMSGLHLNLSKCEIWCIHEPSDNIAEAYPSEVSQGYNDGTFVPSTPIGSHRFME